MVSTLVGCLPKVLVGCPVRSRAWILPRWFEAVNVAFEKSGLDPDFFFVVGQNNDNTDEIVAPYPHVKVEEKPLHVHRSWTTERYRHMVEIRNLLLQNVRERQPDYFFSLDSDILLHPNGLSYLLQSIESYDAVGGKTYMTDRGVRYPSYANINARGMLRRPDLTMITKVDVIMAIKLMKPVAYNVDYKFSDQGEDIGWSKNCKKAGLRLGFDGRIASKHVMRPQFLDRFDSRVGY